MQSECPSPGESFCEIILMTFDRRFFFGSHSWSNTDIVDLPAGDRTSVASLAPLWFLDFYR